MNPHNPKNKPLAFSLLFISKSWNTLKLYANLADYIHAFEIYLLCQKIWCITLKYLDLLLQLIELFSFASNSRLIKCGKLYFCVHVQFLAELSKRNEIKIFVYLQRRKHQDNKDVVKYIRRKFLFLDLTRF